MRAARRKPTLDVAILDVEGLALVDLDGVVTASGARDVGVAQQEVCTLLAVQRVATANDPAAHAKPAGARIDRGCASSR